MQTTLRSTISAIALLLGYFSALGQTDSDKVIIKAMQDEIARNMAELQLDTYEKPYYISYLLSDLKKLTVQASLGGLLESSLDSGRSWTNRVMVGSYEVNDEKYEDPGINFESSGNYFNQLPIDNNAEGIRRVLWLATNDVYKSAARLYQSKRDLLDQLELDTLPLLDFAKAPTLKHLDFNRLNLPDKSQIEQQVLELSNLFIGYPEFIQPMVSLHVVSGLAYFASSEETLAVFPVSLSILSVSTQYLSADEGFINEAYYAFPEIGQLEKDLSEIKKDLIIFRDAIVDQQALSTYEDLYYGPVMLQGTVVADFFTANLLNRGSRSILATSNALVKQEIDQVKDQLVKMAEALDKPGPKIAHSSVQVRALPTLKSFEGQKVAGAFEVDAEGVKPPDTVSIIQNGQLVELLNGRTPVPLAPVSNGHMRLQIGFGLNIYKTLAPGVLEIKSTDITNNTLTKLKETAASNGLDHALVISSLPLTKGYSSMVSAAKVSVKDGQSEAIKLSAIRLNTSNALMKLIGASDKQSLTNKLLGMGGSGAPISILAPEEVIIDGFDYDNSPQQGYSNRKYTPSISLPNQ